MKLSGLPVETSFSLSDFVVKVKAAAAGDVLVTLQNLINFIGLNGSNPYKFSVYRNAAQTPVSAVVGFDTKLYDTGGNVDVVTNKGRFTAPIAGFYHVTGLLTFSTTSANVGVDAGLMKNGVGIKQGTRTVAMYAGSYTHAYIVSGDVQLAAGDYLEVAQFAGSTFALLTGQANTFFDGYLISKT